MPVERESSWPATDTLRRCLCHSGRLGNSGVPRRSSSATLFVCVFAGQRQFRPRQHCGANDVGKGGWLETISTTMWCIERQGGGARKYTNESPWKVLSGFLYFFFFFLTEKLGGIGRQTSFVFSSTGKNTINSCVFWTLPK